ncbi:MAG: tRNA (adenosine(37)-N6)-threonylcarbamoyltransferase complex transferase subunit TsaD [Clostridia bacterium]|nr:tRNA (adenosine(37)-N6)-threonylcarbamoyltransferase complex transferase subunit TsaD [Clostridia bacterium]MDE7328194.1 tRNA (adenosine(37)-N6)-threonylcarbamoyltransferase complex transferase subunit TsaD [Clostridia bacterium]
MRNREDIVILAIESSCDETAAAVTRGRELLSNVIASQIDVHKRFGGVVPEIASRNHTVAIGNVVKQALEEASVTLDEVDCIAVTYGAGLLGALLVGVSYAKALAYAAKKPLIAVNHIKGHIAANYLAKPDLQPPYLCLIASGGHTTIAYVKSLTEIEIKGTTQDDACGEAFDKVARVLGLPYPGGPQIEKLAKDGKPNIELPTPYKNKDTYDFSYSGIKTAVINYAHKCEQKGEEIRRADLACSFQEKVTDIMVDNTLRCAKEMKVDTVVIAGGVGANSVLREKMQIRAKALGIKVFYPPMILCTDNGAMIASAAYNMIKSGATASDCDLDANANVRVSD